MHYGSIPSEVYVTVATLNPDETFIIGAVNGMGIPFSTHLEEVENNIRFRSLAIEPITGTISGDRQGYWYLTV